MAQLRPEGKKLPQALPADGVVAIHPCVQAEVRRLLSRPAAIELSQRRTAAPTMNTDKKEVLLCMDHSNC